MEKGKIKKSSLFCSGGARDSGLMDLIWYRLPWNSKCVVTITSSNFFIETPLLKELRWH